MKLFRFIENQKIKPGLCINDTLYDASSLVEDYNESFFSSYGLAKLKELVNLKTRKLPKLPKKIKFAPPVSRPSKIICVGLNYADHAMETNCDLPSEPVLFMKASTALCGPYDEIHLPPNSKKTDWEVELAVIVGRKAVYINEEEASDYIAGYCLHNDVSERSFQLERGGTWDKGKGCNTFAPLGPFLVTPDELSDVNNLNLWLSVNGEVMQKGNTANLIFKIPFLISYVSQFMTLLPGDIISTGTPAGVGMGKNPAVFLQPGDLVELGIDGLGSSHQRVKAHEQN